MKNRISLIVPAYNVEDYIEECLVSLLKQTFKDIEIIIVDDGSTDNTKAIIKHYCKRDNRIILVEQKNAGTSVARNNGVTIASGKYIMFVDSDDWISHNACEILYHQAEYQCLDVLVFDYYYMIEDKRICRNSYLDSNVISGVNFIKGSLEKNIFCLSPWNKIIKRKLALETPFRSGFIHEDIEFTYLLMLKAERVSMISDSLYFYRRFRSGSNTSEFKLMNLENLFNIYSFIEKEMRKKHDSRLLLNDKYYKLAKFEKLNMESLYKLIDNSNRINDDNEIVCFLKKNKKFIELSKFYLQFGGSVKHKMVVSLFMLNSKFYIYLGRLLYPFLKRLNIAA